MTGLFRPHYSFLTNNSWQKQAANALRYNTSQIGMVVPHIYGTIRQQINLLALANYRGPGGGKKGKGVGPLPIGGTTQTAKGGGGGKKGGKKATPDFTVDCDLGVCEGPATIFGDSAVYASSQVATFSSLPLHFYNGANGQAPDPTAYHLGALVGYSGTCHVTGTPLNLGPSPMLPNLGIEISGFLYGTMENGFDADPGQVILHFLTDQQRGLLFPIENVDQDSLNSLSQYCGQFGFGVSFALDGQQSGLEWLGNFLKLLNSTMVWSGDLLRFVPLPDSPVGSWQPNLEAQYRITADDMLRDAQKFGSEVLISDRDPVEIIRTNPTDVPNWMSIEYTDRQNFYNSTIITAFDQSSIDLYGLRIGDNLNGKAFSNAAGAGAAAQSILQRLQYVRNTYKFKLGFRHSLLEPMDSLVINGSAEGEAFLNDTPLRIQSIEEDDNGELMLECEEIPVGSAHPVSNQPPQAPLEKIIAYGSVPPMWNMDRVGDFLTRSMHPDWSKDYPDGTISIWFQPTLTGMNTVDGSPLDMEHAPEKAYGGIFCAYSDGAIWWDGLDDGGNQWSTLVSPTDPMYIFMNPGFPPINFYYTGDGAFHVTFTKYAGKPPIDSFFHYGGPIWHPWQVAGSISMSTHTGLIGFSGRVWFHVYLSWDVPKGKFDLYINGVGAHLRCDDFFTCGTYGYINPTGYGWYGPISNTVIEYVGWHAATWCGFMLSPQLLYYLNGLVGCWTDAWFVRGHSLGSDGWKKFRNPSTGRAVWDLGEFGEKPLGGIIPDIYYRNRLMYTPDLLFRMPDWIYAYLGATQNHARSDEGGGLLGFREPTVCYDGPW